MKHLWTALITGCGLSDKDVRSLKTDPLTGDFELVLNTVGRGHAPPIDNESPAGLILLLGGIPEAGDRGVVKGRIDADGATFDCGVALFIMTNLATLSPLYKTIANAVLLLPTSIGDFILKKCGVVVDRASGALETHVLLKRLVIHDAMVTHTYELLGNSTTIPPKDHTYSEVVRTWSHAVPIHTEDHRSVLRAAYSQMLMSGTGATMNPGQEVGHV